MDSRLRGNDESKSVSFLLCSNMAGFRLRPLFLNFLRKVSLRRNPASCVSSLLCSNMAGEGILTTAAALNFSAEKLAYAETPPTFEQSSG